MIMAMPEFSVFAKTLFEFCYARFDDVVALIRDPPTKFDRAFRALAADALPVMLDCTEQWRGHHVFVHIYICIYMYI